MLLALCSGDLQSVHFGDCNDPFAIGFGAKNGVFECGNTPSVVRRVALLATFELELNKGVQPPMACRVMVGQLLRVVEDYLHPKSAVRGWGSKNPTKEEAEALNDVRFVLNERLKHGLTDLDLVSDHALRDEQSLTASAAAAPLPSGVNIPPRSVRVSINMPIPKNLRCSSKHNKNYHDTGIKELVLVIESHNKFEMGSARKMKEKKNLTEADEGYILHSMLGGQADLLNYAGRFHTDGHRGNLLVQREKADGRLSVVWNDFGKTTSHKDATQDHENEQFCRTLNEWSDFFNHPSIASIAKELKDLYVLDDDGKVQCSGHLAKFPSDDKILAKIEYLLVSLEELVQLKNFGDDIWPRPSGRRMGKAVGDLKVQVADLSQNVTELQAFVSQLQAQIKALVARIKALEGERGKQNAEEEF